MTDLTPILEARIAEAFPDPADRPAWTVLVREHPDFKAVAKMRASDRCIGMQLDKIIIALKSTEA